MCPFVSVKPTFFSPELSVYTTIVSLIGALKMVSTNLTIVTIKVKQEMILFQYLTPDNENKIYTCNLSAPKNWCWKVGCVNFIIVNPTIVFKYLLELSQQHMSVLFTHPPFLQHIGSGLHCGTIFPNLDKT